MYRIPDSNISFKMGCLIPECTNFNGIKTSGITYHSFPQDPDLRKAWTDALDITNYLTVDLNSKICSEHFTEDSFYETKHGRQLHPAALPTMIPELCPSDSLLVCRICLVHHSDMHHIKQFSEAFEQLTSIAASDGEAKRLPQRLCWECAARLRAAATFKDKALRSNTLLRDLLNINVLLKIQDIKKIDRRRNGLKTFLVQTHFDNEHFDVKIDDSFVATDIEPYLFENNHVEDEKTDGNTHNTPKVRTKEKAPTNKQNKVGNLKIANNKQENDSNKDSMLYVEHSYSNMNSNDNKNIAQNNITTEVERSIENNDYDVSNDMLGNYDAEMDDLESQISEENGNIGNWNIEVEKSSQTISIFPLHSTASKNNKYRKDIPKELFTITPLRSERLVAEIKDRQNSPAYINNPYKCTVCYMGFKIKDVHDRHMLKHSDKSGLFECFICKIHKKKRHLVRSHIQDRHSHEYKCRKCNFVTRFKPLVHEHIKFHAGNKYKCELCPSVFDHKTSYLGHRRLFHLPSAVCWLCGYTFLNRFGVLSHQARQHILDKDKELVGPHCDKCDVKFLSQEAYDKHLHLSAKHVKNEYDPIRIRNEIGYKRTKGIQRQKGDEGGDRRKIQQLRRRLTGPYTCEQCGVKMRNYAVYAIHFSRAHPNHSRAQYLADDALGDWMCEHCGGMFMSKWALKGHQWVHTGTKPLVCDHCGKTFVQKAALVGHMQAMHQETAPANKCTVCGKVFVSLHNLKKHAVVHTGEKPFECEYCHKKFGTTDGVNSHIKHVHYKIPWPKKTKKNVDEE